MKRRTIIIAEAGVNHNGSLDRAMKMVDVAASAGVDYIKFQTAVPHLLVSAKAKKAEYQEKTTGKEGGQLEMLRKILLPFEDFVTLNDYCLKKGIGFLSTPFDLKSIDFLSELNMDFWKIPSGEITNLPYLRHIAKQNGSIIMSTGMCSEEEIVNAIIAIRKINPEKEIHLLHCNTEYPTPMEDVNLLAMKSFEKYNISKIGYSDHTLGIEVPIAAVALGAQIIEKHFTLDKALEGPDHKASVDPQELTKMVKAIRNIEIALGDSEKRITPSESKNISAARKSIVANAKISKGELLTEDNITTKRPGNGLSPMLWDSVIGKKAKKDFEPDDLIEI